MTALTLADPAFLGLRRDYRAVVLSDSPVAFWPMQEASGNLIDASGNGHTAVATGGTPDYQQSGPTASVKAVNLDGSTEHFVVADSDAFSSTSFSLEMWTNLDGNAANMFLFEKRVGANFNTLEYHLYAYPSNGMYFQMANQAGTTYADADTGTGLSPNLAGNWSHMVATFDGATSVIYRNGVQVASKALASGTRVGNTSASLRLGYRALSAFFPLDGRMTMAAYYGTALSAARVAAHYAAMV